ncbi:MAG: citramalate synthase [Oscillospiraceae bacterium]|nr:citramalate synthase [Oscillospiraceae bacterium]
MNAVEIYDSTLRDGAQSRGISFSVSDKLKILSRLDEFGVDYIEAGNPGSNPKDLHFFEKAKLVRLKNSALVAFGSTKRKLIAPCDDDNLNAILKANTKYATIFGKSWDLHVFDILDTTLLENLKMIEQSIEYLIDKGKTVFFDAEHFFDGYKNNRDYSLDSLKVAHKAGAEKIILCDTNGGFLPHEIFEIVADVKRELSDERLTIGIHAHNDSGCAVANSIEAVRAGARQIQGTFIGIGERTGNANLSTLIPNLEAKTAYKTLAGKNMGALTDTAHYIAEVANLALSSRMPYVGTAAFSHKGGMHVDGVLKNPVSFEHIEPCVVGNERNVLLSEVAGRGAVIAKIMKIGQLSGLEKSSPIVNDIIAKIKKMEHKGFHFEAAAASFELLVLKMLGKIKPFFVIENFEIISSLNDSNLSTATVTVRVDDVCEMVTLDGTGPVNAIDRALRAALEKLYPVLCGVRLSDYKVRVVDEGNSTASTTRVLIESTNGKETWTTVGASKDIINASIQALSDSLEYILIRRPT